MLKRTAVLSFFAAFSTLTCDVALFRCVADLTRFVISDLLRLREVFEVFFLSDVFEALRRRLVAEVVAEMGASD